MLDFEFLALLICGAFGWTLPQVFSLTLPQFMKAGVEVRRVQFQRAKNEIYFGVCAALGGGETQEDLMQSAGSVLIEPPEPELNYTEEELRQAEARMAAIIAQRKKEQEAKNGI
jgi:hypothetical protein